MKCLYKIGIWFLIVGFACCLAGCQAQGTSRRRGLMYDFPDLEAQWIRDGQPLQFEGELWYPQDNVDIFLDSEIYPVGSYKGVKIFIDKVDVRPYNRLYTKFGVNRFRSFEKRDDD